jgi:uncharacterized protein
MKFLLFLAIVLLLAWLWRSGRRKQERPGPESPPTTPSAPQEMVRCARCGLHLPQADAVVGRIGQYCSHEHRQQAEP